LADEPAFESQEVVFGREGEGGYASGCQDLQNETKVTSIFELFNKIPLRAQKLRKRSAT
jgi:hypothetical protein